MTQCLQLLLSRHFLESGGTISCLPFLEKELWRILPGLWYRNLCGPRYVGACTHSRDRTNVSSREELGNWLRSTYWISTTILKNARDTSFEELGHTTLAFGLFPKRRNGWNKIQYYCIKPERGSSKHQGLRQAGHISVKTSCAKTIFALQILDL